MSGWEHESKALFVSARGAMTPTKEDRERVRARLAAKLGAAAVGAGAATAAKTASAASTTKATATAGAGAVVAKGGAAALATKLAVPVAIAVAVASAAGAKTMVDARRPAKAATPTVIVAPSVVAAVTPAPIAAPEAPSFAVDALPSAAPSAPKPQARTATSPPPAPEDRRDSEAERAAREEAALVSRMNAELRAGHHATAAKLAAEHERRFPNGLLAEEREGARVLARCATAGREGSGAEAFLAAHPRSPMRERILATCTDR